LASAGGRDPSFAAREKLPIAGSITREARAMGPVDLFATVLALAVLLGCVNHIWARLPPAIGMLLGSLAVSLVIVASDHVLHLHVMRWFRGTLGAADLPHLFLDGALALLLFAGSLHVAAAALGRPRCPTLFFPSS